MALRVLQCRLPLQVVRGQSSFSSPKGGISSLIRHFVSGQAVAARGGITSKDTQSLDSAFDILKSVPTAWSHAGPAEFDFRSDVVTTPTLSMLRAILETTLQDDVYREDHTTKSLESHMAELTGHESGIFVLSGSMGNQISLRTHLVQPPHAILCDDRSHIIHWEAGGIASMSGAMVQAVSASNGEWLTLEDIQKRAIISDDVHLCPTAVISLENTISGLVHPLQEIRKISRWARQHGIKLHMDGARLWEAVATGGGSLRDYAQCFDSVSIDFSKGLGAPMGAMIVGNAGFVHRARRIRKSVGGGMRQAGVLSSAARAAVNESFGPGVWGRNKGGKLVAVHRTAQRVVAMWTSKGGSLLRRVETNIVYVDLQKAGINREEFCALGKKFGVKLDGCRLVMHFQITESALLRLDKVFKEVFSAFRQEEKRANVV